MKKILYYCFLLKFSCLFFMASSSSLPEENEDKKVISQIPNISFSIEGNVNSTVVTKQVNESLSSENRGTVYDPNSYIYIVKFLKD